MFPLFEGSFFARQCQDNVKIRRNASIGNHFVERTNPDGIFKPLVIQDGLSDFSIVLCGGAGAGGSGYANHFECQRVLFLLGSVGAGTP
jgi:hypothetical protein